MTKIRVIAAVVDARQLTLYQENGETITISQGNPELRRLVDEVLPVCSKGGVAEVSLNPETTGPNHYSEFEEKSGGLVRLFRVAKKVVKSFFENPYEKEPVPNMVIGEVPGVPVPVAQEEAPLSAAVDEIIANAVPVGSTHFLSPSAEDTTLVAVVGDKVIPGVENLERQFANANKLGSTLGVQRFLERLSKVIDQRSHSVHDLLRFMEKGDLPIADDGSIIIYKSLTSHSSKSSQYPGYVFDIHSKNVPQKVGSYVHMDHSLVDHNRRRECSNGLHVARRNYIRTFTGDVCVLAKVAPEDVIAVPDYDADKMRVCGYHILFVVPKEAHDLLNKNQPMTSCKEAAHMLGAAIKGNHVGILERVKITAGNGGGIEITQVVGIGAPAKVKQSPKVEVINIEDPVEAPKAPVVDPKAIAKETVALEQEAPAAEPAKAPVVEPVAKAEPTRIERARALFVAGDMLGVRQLKKTAKVGWDRLGFTTGEVALITTEQVAPLVEAAKEAEKLNEPIMVKVKKVAAKPAKKAPIRKEKASKVLAPVAAKDPASMTRNELAADAFLTEDWEQLKAIKKKAKVSWARLGFAPQDEAVILKNIGG